MPRRPKSTKQEFKWQPKNVEEKETPQKKIEKERKKEEELFFYDKEKETVQEKIPSDFVEKELDVSLDSDLVERAVIALKDLLKKKLEQRKKKLLFDPEDYFSLFICVRDDLRKRISPFLIPLPHPLYGDDIDICIFVADPEEKYKEIIEKTKIPNITNIIGIKRLRDDFSQYADRRKLLKSYDLFICDRRVRLLLNGLLGKCFFNLKKFPIAIDIGNNKNTVAKSIARVRDSACLYIPNGRILNVKIAQTSHSVKDISENIMESIQNIIKEIPGKWNNILSISVKTSLSVTLPIYNKL